MKPILEPIHLGEQRTIMGFYYAKKNFETPWHFHPQHELTYIEESVGTKFIGNYVGSYQPGELVLLRSNLPHCWKNSTQQEGLSRSVVVQWNVGVFPKVPELAPIFDMLKTASKGIIFDKQDSAPLIAQLKTFPQLEGPDLYLQLLTLLAQLAKCPYRTLSETSFTDDLPTEYSTRMAKIHDFVGAHFDRKVYLKELSDLVNMSEQSFSRFFTKMMGRSFFVFLNEYRINMAARMLLDTDDTVAQIGYACGYESLQFFHKKFGELHGITPLKYRQQYAGERYR
ncbi:AraC-like DNA-binding protein [Dyadobacter jejuensis]|uniref:AraC-like DNA-binding protein n=1 Tax=Dyadobacter jejuensis TaxID=1082580 RepID=A0A316AR98_9BACT|nr:AraC family transcriptional regulator [Dyadobacter jejuensis]PWJ60028.1 AraC-like DNA-binding protein [Dyadobacter jejuensis]